LSYNNQEGSIIIATPNITNKLYQKSVIYIHTDDSTGTIGVMLNVPMEHDVAVKFAREIDWEYPDRIHHGGPTEQQLGYVLHSMDYDCENSIQLNIGIGYTGGKHIVDDINSGLGPKDFMLITGYCQWAPHQLSVELDNAMWTRADFDSDYFFQDQGRDQGWVQAVNLAAHNRTSKLLS
jgi:putative transcriptional regulator